MRLVRSARLDASADRLGLQIVVERRVTHLTSPSGLLVATERKRGIEDVVAVDPDGASAQAIRDSMRTPHVARIDAGSEAIGRIVRASDEVIVRILERNDGD